MWYSISIFTSYQGNPGIVSTIRIPIGWNEDAECPEIDKFFSEVFPSDAIELAYEILGYMLYNDNPLHKAILLYGSGRNGKGTFIRLARMLVGHANISAVTPQALDSSQFSSAQLYEKLANLVGDVDPRIFKSTEQFMINMVKNFFLLFISSSVLKHEIILQHFTYKINQI